VCVISVVVETVCVELHCWIGVGGDALGSRESGVVVDEEPSLLALEGGAGDLRELGASNELGYLGPGDGAVFLVRQCDLLPQQHVFLREPVTPARQTRLLVLVPALDVRPCLDLGRDVLPALSVFRHQ